MQVAEGRYYGKADKAAAVEEFLAANNDHERLDEFRQEQHFQSLVAPRSRMQSFANDPAPVMSPARARFLSRASAAGSARPPFPSWAGSLPFRQPGSFGSPDHSIHGDRSRAGSFSISSPRRLLGIDDKASTSTEEGYRPRTLSQSESKTSLPRSRIGSVASSGTPSWLHDHQDLSAPSSPIRDSSPHRKRQSWWKEFIVGVDNIHINGHLNHHSGPRSRILSYPDQSARSPEVTRPRYNSSGAPPDFSTSSFRGVLESFPEARASIEHDRARASIEHDRARANTAASDALPLDSISQNILAAVEPPEAIHLPISYDKPSHSFSLISGPVATPELAIIEQELSMHIAAKLFFSGFDSFSRVPRWFK